MRDTPNPDKVYPELVEAMRDKLIAPTCFLSFHIDISEMSEN